MTEKDSIPNILFVLDSAPEDNASLALFNGYLRDLIEAMKKYARITLFYPLFSDTGPYYELTIKNDEPLQRCTTKIPPRAASFADSFSNAGMESLFDRVISENNFDLVHFFSLKNHSLGYPFLARKAGLPSVLTVHDFYITCPIIFGSRCEEAPGSNCGSCVMVSNFVASPLYLTIRRIGDWLKPKNQYHWFEQVGRYSEFYNRGRIESVAPSLLEDRKRMSEELISIVDRFHFFSEAVYNLRLRHFIPESKAVFIPQGINTRASTDNRPFEINGHVSYGFIGDILPEEGLEELIEAFNLIFDRRLHNTLHLYGDIFSNRDYVARLKKLSKNPNIIFHGAIDPARIGAALDTFDVLLIPSKWQRSDTWLVNTAFARRKAVIASDRNAPGDTVRRLGRGVTLNTFSPSELADLCSELEFNRKKLYYFMRISDSEQYSTIEENIRALLAAYKPLMQHRSTEAEKIVTHKFYRKKADRIRGKNDPA